MQIIKNFIYNVSYQVLVILLPLITVPYVSNILGASGIGEYAFTFANMQYFIIIGMIGIGMYGNRQIAYVRDNQKMLKNTFWSIYTLQLIATSTSLLVYLIFFVILKKEPIRTLYLVQAINIVATIFDISWLFIGLEQFKKTVLRNTMVKIVSLFSIFIFVKDSDDVAVYAIIIGLSALLGNLTLWMYIPKIVGKIKIKISGIRYHLKESISLFVPQIAIQVYILLDKTILGILTDSVQVGYYENSQKIVKIALTVATSLGIVMMPKMSNMIANRDLNKVRKYCNNSFFFINAISIPLMFGLIGISDGLAPWFFSNKFNGIEKLMKISAVIIIPMSWSNVLGVQLLIPLKKTHEFTISVTSGAIINLILNLFMIRYWGAFGACIATICAEVTVAIIQIYFAKKFLEINKMVKEILIFIVPAIVMCLIIRVIGDIYQPQIIITMFQVIVGGISYILGLEIICRLVKKVSLVIYIREIIN